MRTTIELPDALLAQARLRAVQDGISLKEFFVEAIEQKLNPPKPRTRRPPPVVGSPRSPRIGILSAEQLDDAMFG
jgi:hypothetical protein